MQFSPEFRRRYVVERVLGEGGVGRVLLARDEELGRQVAIKLMLAPDPDGLENKRFFEEARTCALLKHPNIVAVLRDGVEQGHPYVVFEYVEGRTLLQHIEASASLGEAETLTIARGIAAGLAHAHEKGVIHRDLKPQNILLDATDGRPRITDFGMAKSDSRQGFRTKTGLIVGTPFYLAPELIEGVAASPGSDLFSLGVTLHECLTGKPPFNGPSLLVIVEEILKSEPQPVCELRNDVSRETSELVSRLLAKDPRKRIRTAAKVLEVLDAVEEARRREQGAASSGVPRGPRSKTGPTRAISVSQSLSRPRANTLRTVAIAPPLRRRPYGAWVLGAVLSCIILGVLFRFLDSEQTPEAARSPRSDRSVDNPDLALVERLARGLDGFRVEQVVREIVLDKQIFDSNVTFLCADFEAVDDPGAHTVRRPRSGRGACRRAVEARISREPFADDLRRLESVASRVFADGFDERLKLRLYAGLLKLQYLDLLSRAQQDDDIHGYHRLYAPLVRYLTPELPAVNGKATPGAIPLVSGMGLWVHKGYESAPDVKLWMETSRAYKEALGIERVDYETEKKRFRNQATVEVALPRVDPRGRLRLEAVVAWFSPGSVFEVRIDREETEPPVSLLITHPGSLDWYVAMDGWEADKLFGFDADTSGTKEFRGHQKVVWGRLSLSFPASLFPVRRTRVSVHYRTLPGVRQHEVSYLARSTFLKELRIVPEPGSR